ncbi:MAG: dTMP kinase [Pseudonocardiaceae bacterium]
MGRLIVIEGVDGAGKRTLADGLSAALTEQHASVTRMAFPRYGSDIHAELVRDALYGRLGDLPGSVHGMAVLFALDRRGAAETLRALQHRYDVVLVDRYVASNAAYGAARLEETAEGPFVEWIHELEVDRFGVPVPDVHLLLQVPVSVASARAQRRAEADSARAKDLYEADGSLQARCALLYEGLAARGWLAPWSVLTNSEPPLRELARQLLGG